MKDQSLSPRGAGASRYQAAGVDIDAADRAKERIARLLASTHGPEVLRGVGHFGGFFQAPGASNQSVLVSSADSVGTKILVAILAEHYESLGADIVNHCVNDILACGALPLFFLDYIASADFDSERLHEVMIGMAAACRAAGCAIVGGETAQLPGIYREGTFDLAGFIVGAVERDRIIDGSGIEAGDVLIGLPSDGLHTNGFSLARAALGLDGDPSEARRRLEVVPEWSDRPLAELLLARHRSYLPVVAPLLESHSIAGMAHVTGGGIAGNVRRIVPEGLQAAIDISSWDVPPLFRHIQRAGDVSDVEMYRVFNMGIGFVLVVHPSDALTGMGQLDGACRIGEIRRAATGGARYEGLSDAPGT